MGLSLVAFDTDHIKQYVFGTNKLKEIRGASSRLDYLNRIVMNELASGYAEEVYAHGGSGLFLVDTEHVDIFKVQVQQAYHDETGEGASITAVDLPVPEHIDVHKDDIKDLLDLLQWRLQEEKVCSATIIALPSHPFMRPCDACGVEYVDARDRGFENAHDFDIDDEADPGEEGERYCESCYSKRSRDFEVKSFIRNFINPKETKKGKRLNDYLWKKIISRLSEPEMQYKIPLRTRRPKDFNIFRNFKGSKDYLALVYADANNMGRAIEQYTRLDSRKTFANTIDNAVYEAVCTAITRHLTIDNHLKPQVQPSDDLKHPVFPFDILLMGGDDICMVVPASVALDVALVLSETFYKETENAHKAGKIKSAHTLSVGVVLAPVKYPFGLLQEMAETTLKFAKKSGADARAKKKDDNDTRINFMIVTGSTTPNFKLFHNTVYHKQDNEKYQEFYATLRPYKPDELRMLLDSIRGKDGASLGRTKLHQIREAVLKLNLTTSVSDGLSVLHNWHDKQRNHVVHQVYEFAGHHQMQYSNPDDPVSGFPRVIFPWFKYDTKMYNKHEYTIYRTPLLDFIELYDFISRDEGENAEER